VKLKFFGATHEVSGSCTLLSMEDCNILIDCGMEQGKDIFVNEELDIDPASIDYVFVTHAHIDHTGRLPLLVKNGFKGEIYASKGTAELCGIMLRDSAHIQESEAEWKNRKAARAGREEVRPIYGMQDAEDTLKLFVPCEYHRVIKIRQGITAEFFDAGHLLGSASIRLNVRQRGRNISIVFSGDIGNINKPILRDPEAIDSADFVVMESTYGDRTHPKAPDYIKNLTDILNDTFSRGGNVVIPSFAVGRTQELLYFLRVIKQEKLVEHAFKVYVDSPLAVKATQVFNQNTIACCDEETAQLLRRGINPIAFDGLVTSQTAEESKAINQTGGCKVIISSSGMCTAGRIRHHLKHNLWRGDSSVLFVGYQSAGTLGRALLDGAKTVRIFGEEIAVNAKIFTLEGISGHADMNGLIAWVSNFKKKPTVFVNHGDEACAESLTARLKEMGYIAHAPYSGDAYLLPGGELAEQGSRERVVRKAPDSFEQRLDAAIAALRQRILGKALDGSKQQSVIDKIKEFTKKL